MTRFVDNDMVRLDDDIEQHNNEIDLPEDDEGNFDFGDAGSDEKDSSGLSGTTPEEEPLNDQKDSTIFTKAKSRIATSMISDIQNAPTRKDQLDLTSTSKAKSVLSSTVSSKSTSKAKNVLNSTVGSNGRNAQNVLDSTNVSNGRNVMNSVSFSTTKLAEIDAKFQFAQKNINRMDINEIMASVSLSGRPRYKKAVDSNANSSKVTKPSVFDTPLQAKKSVPLQRQPFENSTIKNEVNSKSGGMLKTARSASTIASQNNSVVSDQVISRSCFISVDKPVLAFGFLGYKTSRKLSVKISNDSDSSLWLQPSITHSENVSNDPKSNEIFKLTDQSSFSLDPHSTHDICVIFEPKKAITYNAQLRLRLMSKNEPEFLIRMFGYGGRSELELRTQSFDKVEMGSDGVGICEIDRSSKQTQMILTNKGQRDAFAHIIAVDANNQPLSSSIISVEPCRVVVQKNTKEYVKVNVSFRYGLGSTTMIKTRSTSQVSIASTHSTRTLHNEGLARLQIIWGEERLRRRLKCYLNNNTDENVPISLMDYVTSEFRGETEFKTEKIVGRWDLARFSDSSRLTTVQFVDLHVRPQSSAATISRPPSSASIRNLPNQTLANTMAASQTSHQYSMFSNATVDDDTMPIHNRRNQRHH